VLPVPVHLAQRLVLAQPSDGVLHLDPPPRESPLSRQSTALGWLGPTSATRLDEVKAGTAPLGTK
jgi:hypothetical protein